MFSSKPRFDSNKCKVQLKMLILRLNLLTSKKANLAKAEKRNVAMLLRETKEHNARILVEQIIREDYLLEVYDMLKQYTEMLIARFNVVTTAEDLKPEIADGVTALVYAGYLMGQDIDELKALFNLFTAKYGKAFTQEVLDHKERYLTARLVEILSYTQVPDPTVVDAYLTEIVRQLVSILRPTSGSSHPCCPPLAVCSFRGKSIHIALRRQRPMASNTFQSLPRRCSPSRPRSASPCPPPACRCRSRLPTQASTSPIPASSCHRPASSPVVVRGRAARAPPPSTCPLPSRSRRSWRCQACPHHTRRCSRRRPLAWASACCLMGTTS